jgi:cobalt-zinc-cadmium efflux system outer membrane protein
MNRLIMIFSTLAALLGSLTNSGENVFAEVRSAAGRAPIDRAGARDYRMLPGGAVAGVEGGISPSTVSASSSQLRLESLISELLKENPELQAARKRYEAALTRPSQVNSLPDPRITMGWISNGNPLPGAGLGVEPTSNIGFQIAQEVPYPGKRTLKGSVARKEAESEAQMYRAKEQSLVAQLKASFYELRFVYEAMDILAQDQALLRRLAKVAEVRYSVGKATQQDLIKSEVEISILENRIIVLEQRKAKTEAEINALLNRTPESPLGRPEPLDRNPPLESLQSLQNQVEQASPMLRSQQAIVDSRHLGIQMAQKEYYPDLDFMGGYYNQGTLKDMWEFKVQLKVPFYFWRKQRYGLEEAALRLVESQRTYRSTEQELTFRLRERYRTAEASLKLMELYSKQIVPQSKFALESSLASYETGSVDLLTVLSNFTTILEYETNYYEQRAEYLKALASLEELVAKPLDGLNRGGVQQ